MAHWRYKSVSKKSNFLWFFPDKKWSKPRINTAKLRKVVKTSVSTIINPYVDLMEEFIKANVKWESKTAGKKIILYRYSSLKRISLSSENTFSKFPWFIVVLRSELRQVARSLVRTKSFPRSVDPMVTFTTVTATWKDLIAGTISKKNLYESLEAKRSCFRSGNALNIFSIDLKRCRKRFQTCEKIICPASYDPVCGTDGQTYINYCLMHKANCK